MKDMINVNTNREVKSEQLNDHKGSRFDIDREIEMSLFSSSLGPYPLDSIEIGISESRIIKSEACDSAKE